MQYNAFIFFNAIETRFVTAQNKIKKMPNALMEFHIIVSY